jgi:hypothetical protein
MPNLKFKYEMDFNDLPTFPETHTSFQLLGLVASNCIDLPKYGGIVVGGLGKQRSGLTLVKLA